MRPLVLGVVLLVVVAVAVPVGLSASTVGPSHGEAVVVWGDEQEGLQVGVGLADRVFGPDEDVWLLATMRNVSDQPVVIRDMGGWPTWVIELHGEEGLIFRNPPWSPEARGDEARSTSIRGGELQPGGEWHGFVRLVESKKKLPTGQYTVVVRRPLLREGLQYSEVSSAPAALSVNTYALPFQQLILMAKSEPSPHAVRELGHDLRQGLRAMDQAATSPESEVRRQARKELAALRDEIDKLIEGLDRPAEEPEGGEPDEGAAEPAEQDQPEQPSPTEPPGVAAHLDELRPGVAVPRDPEGGISLTVTTPRAEILVCEPFVLDIAVRNGGDTEVRVQPIFCLCDASVTITDPTGATARYEDMVAVVREAAPLVPIQPGSSYRRRFILLYSGAGHGGFAFPAPGEYSVQMHYSPSGRKEDVLASEALSVRCHAAAGRAAEALAVLREGRWPDALVNARAANSASVRTLGSEYGETPYGQYARFFLAKGRLWEADADENRELAQVFGALAEVKPPFPLADECLLNLATCHLATGSPDQAAAALNRLVEEFPHSPVAGEAKVVLDGMDGD